MGALSKVRNAITWPWTNGPAKDRRLAISEGLSWDLVFGLDNASGKAVNNETALQLATVYACVQKTAQALASLPLKIYRKSANGDRTEVDDSPLALVLKNPNARDTDVEFWEIMVARAVLNGDGLAHKRYSGRNLIALDPINALPFRRPSDNALRYRIWDRGQTDELDADEVFRVPGFGIGGDSGLSAIRYGAQSLGMSLAAESTAAKMFSNGMQPSGLLTTETKLTAEQRTQLQTIMSQYSGSTNAGKLMILEAGLKYQAMALNPEDAQMLETRRFHVEDICRWFGVPPIVIGHAAEGVSAWGTGIEQILLHWLVSGINPLALRIEARIKKSLIAPADRRTIYGEFMREAMLQMDSKTKGDFLAQLSQGGFITSNEGRGKLNLPRSNQPGADLLRANSASVPLDMLGQKQTTTAAPAAA